MYFLARFGPFPIWTSRLFWKRPVVVRTFPCLHDSLKTDRIPLTEDIPHTLWALSCFICQWMSLCQRLSTLAEYNQACWWAWQQFWPVVCSSIHPVSQREKREGIRWGERDRQEKDKLRLWHKWRALGKRPSRACHIAINIYFWLMLCIISTQSLKKWISLFSKDALHL